MDAGITCCKKHFTRQISSLPDFSQKEAMAKYTESMQQFEDHRRYDQARYTAEVNATAFRNGRRPLYINSPAAISTTYLNFPLDSSLAEKTLTAKTPEGFRDWIDLAIISATQQRLQVEYEMEERHGQPTMQLLCILASVAREIGVAFNQQFATAVCDLIFTTTAIKDDTSKQQQPIKQQQQQPPKKQQQQPPKQQSPIVANIASS
jgi:hypothetical protein